MHGQNGPCQFTFTTLMLNRGCIPTKQPGVWYRNFSSFKTLAVGESFDIPVALVDHI